MSSGNFINPSDDVINNFSSAVLEEVDKDFLGLFLSMYSVARLIAVDECGENVDWQIDRSAWQRGKWSVLRRPKRSGRYGFWLTLFRYANRLIPIGIGFSLSELSTRYWWFAVSVLLFAITFVCQERLEDKR